MALVHRLVALAAVLGIGLLAACSGARLPEASSTGETLLAQGPAAAASGLGRSGPSPLEEKAAAEDAPAVAAARARGAAKGAGVEPVAADEPEPAPADTPPGSPPEAPSETPAASEEPAAEPAEPAEPAKPVPCPPLLVSGDVDEPLRKPWEPHQPAYYGECDDGVSKKGACPPKKTDHEKSHARISDEYVRPDPCNVPTRPATLLELGDPFMSPGRISRGFCLPTGQVIRPRLLMYGTARTALQTFNRGRGTRTRSEWVNRLDLFFNLQLSPTERVVLGFRPLSEGTDFSGYEFRPTDDWVNGLNVEIVTLFYEGDVGEMFPRMSPSDFRATDIGFSVGRQPILTQGGIMINDDLDSVGVTRNSIRPRGTSNVLISGLFAWDNIDRGFVPEEDVDGYLYALHTEIDTTPTFLEVDAAAVKSGDRRLGDALFFGLGATQRLGKASTVFRVNQSVALDDETAATGTGTLLTSEISFTPKATDDNLYVNAFGAFGQYDSAARRPESGGPLGGVGIQFASAGLGRSSAPINPRAKDAWGGAVGYQRFFCGGRSNLILELAGRASITGPDTEVGSAAVRYQQAIGSRVVVTAMAFAGWLSATEDATAGGRFEFLFKF